MTKISALPPDTAPTMTDDFATRDVETNTTKRTLLSAVRDLFFTQTNIPAGGGSPVTHEDDGHFDYVVSGGVWSADSVGVNRNASMTAMICYINGRRISISAVTARTFTASKDTYIDVLDNGDGTGTLVYTEATNNAASSALASNSMRIGIIVTGATTIATTGSINQGEENKVLPIASSIAYTVTDSLGNLICPRDPNRQILGYKQITSSITGSAANTVLTGLSVPYIHPTGRKVSITLYSESLKHSTAVINNITKIWDGTVGSGTNLNFSYTTTPGSNYAQNPQARALSTLSAGLHTINGGADFGGATGTFTATSTSPAFLLVELK